MTTSVLNEKNQYLEQFEQLERELGDRDPPWLRRLRKAAIARFAQLGFPTTRNEDWKFTNLSPLTRSAFALARPIEQMRMPDDPVPVCTGVLHDNPVGFLNGFGGSWPDRLETLPNGVIVGSLAEAIRTRPELVERHLARHARYDEQPFAALNTAFLQDGAFIFVPKGVVVEKPIILSFRSVAGVVVHLRNLLLVEENARLTLEEHYFGYKPDCYLTNAVTEIAVGANGSVDHYKVQEETREAFHIATTAVHQAKGSNFRTHYIGLGGKLVRNEIHVRFDGEGCEATVNGLYLASRTQHMDNFTVIDHARPHCNSHELYKGILGGKAHGVFNGKIFVRPDAQKTDAKQTNQTLLLSEDAVINTKPQLEIFADDVKCTHGATVGQLDPNQLFYLRARGLGQEEARNLLTFAFANDIIARIQVEPLRKQLEELLMTRQHLKND